MATTEVQTKGTTPTPAPEPDYKSVFLAEEPEPNPEPEKVPDAATEVKPEPEAKPEPEKVETKPGTPDVALQHTQQRISGIESKIDALLARVDQQGGKPNVQQVEQLTAYQQKLAGLKAMLDKDYAVDDETRKVADALVELSAKVDQVTAENKELRDRVTDVDSRTTWGDEAENYPGVNIKDVWKTSLEDATAEISEEHELAGVRMPDKEAERVILARASLLYRRRAEAAKKSVAAKATPEPTEAKPSPTARRLPPSTPGGAATTVESRGRTVAANVKPGQIEPSQYADLIFQKE